MLPFKKILCPTDFSELGKPALRVAAELACHFGADLQVLHVMEPYLADTVVPAGLGVYGYIPPEASDLQRAESHNNLAALCKDTVAPEVHYTCHIRYGEASRQILNFATEEGTDLIVMVTHARSGLSHLLFGSVTETEVREAPCPVLTINEAQVLHAPVTGTQPVGAPG